jgi:hypothetical protein
MGQAKQRGSFEERKTQSIERKKKERIEREKVEREYWESLTDEEREKILTNRERARRVLSMWGGFGTYF